MGWWADFVQHPAIPMIGFIGLFCLPYNVYRLRKAKEKPDVVYRSQLWKSNLFLALLLLAHPGKAGSGLSPIFFLIGIWYLCSAWPMKQISSTSKKPQPNEVITRLDTLADEARARLQARAEDRRDAQNQETHPE